MNNNQVNT